MRQRVSWLVVLVAINGLFVLTPRLRYRAIVVHHSASETGDYQSIRRAHWARGWFEIGYHLVLSNGSTGIPFGHLQPTRRYTLDGWSVATRSPRHNLTAVHLCVVGNFDVQPPDARTAAAIGRVIRALQDRHGIDDDRILLHRDCNATACPGRHVTREQLVAWARQAAETPPDATYRRTLGGWWPAPGTLVLWLLVHLLLIGSVARPDRSRIGRYDKIEGPRRICIESSDDSSIRRRPTCHEHVPHVDRPSHRRPTPRLPRRPDCRRDSGSAPWI
ncbi:MAG: peptidoglycan recognition family protein [Acidobacteriota bacterium]